MQLIELDAGWYGPESDEQSDVTLPCTRFLTGPADHTWCWLVPAPAKPGEGC